MDTDTQLDLMTDMLQEAWDKLDMFERKKRSNLIFYGVRGEARETQSELIHKVIHNMIVFTFHFIIVPVTYFC